MEYDDFKRTLKESPELAGLDAALAAALFGRCREETLKEGAIVYQEDAALDFTFGLLLTGDLIVEKSGLILGGIFAGQMFGEMAYFTNQRARTATIRVGSSEAVVLRFKLTLEELSRPAFSLLRTALGLQTWNRFVNTSQSGSEYPEVVHDWA